MKRSTLTFCCCILSSVLRLGYQALPLHPPPRNEEQSLRNRKAAARLGRSTHVKRGGFREVIGLNCPRIRPVKRRRLWYNPGMNPSDTLSPSPSYIGHVRNGIVVLDAQISLIEGQAVRVEPLQVPSGATGKLNAELSSRVQRLQQMFEEWTQEDGQLTDEEADRLHVALESNRGLEFRSPDLS